MTEQITLEDATSQTLALAYFFVPLPLGMALPDAWTCQFTTRSQSRIRRRTENEKADPLEVAPYEWMTASVVVHVIDEGSDSAALASCLAAMQMAWHWQSVSAANATSPGLRRQRLVAEVMVPLASDGTGEIDDAFAHAVDCCERLLGAYYFATQRALPTLSAREFPPLIPYAIRLAEKGEKASRWPSREDLRLRLNIQSAAVATNSPGLERDELVALSQATRFPPDGPFARLAEVRRQMVLSQQDSTSTTTAILCGAAAEILFRELLAMLLWEEGEAPSPAARALSNRKISNLVANEIPRRLGGNWTGTGDGVVARWISDIATLRNRVIHIGYVPTTAEAARAVEAHAELGRFIGDRLAEQIAKYPLTARQYLGDAGLNRRNAIGRLARRLEHDLFPADVAHSFSRWRREVRRHTENGPWAGRGEQAVPMLVVYQDRREQWWLMDESVGLCCLAVEPPSMTTHQRDGLDLIRQHLNASPDGRGHIAIRFEATTSPLDPHPKWIPTGDAIPLNEFSRFPLSLLPPPTATRP